MPAVPVTLSPPSWRPKISGALLSMLLHGLVAFLLMAGPWSRLLPSPPEQMVIEMVTLPAPAPARPQPVPPQTVQPEQRPVPPPQTPQLQEAPIAERSTPPPAPVARPPEPTEPSRTDDSSRPPRPAARTARGAPTLAPAPPPDETAESSPFQSGRSRPRGGQPNSVATQAVQDFILGQIKQHWIIDFRGPKFRHIQLFGRFVLQPDGMLAPPFGKNDPWNPRAMISNYDDLIKPGMDPAYRVAIETFLQAVRQAQPFRMPPDGKGEAPRALPLSFLLGTL